MNILIVEDNPSSRTLLRKIVKTDPKTTVVACSNGIEAKEALSKESFDVVLTDWMMPQMDGIELIKCIRRNIVPNPIIIVITALASRDAQNKAMQSGADDYATKPYNHTEILFKIENALLRNSTSVSQRSAEINLQSKAIPNFFGVTIAASTGGPQALLKFFKLLKPSYKATFFVILHAPAWMLSAFVDRLQSETEMKVNLGAEGLEIKAGEVYLAPGDYHMIVNNSGKSIMLLDTPPENFVKPSADPLFKSVAESFGKRTIGVVLTGMGHDASLGCGYINAVGGTVFVQDPKTAMLSSMPKTVVDFGLANTIANLEDIPGLINSYLNNQKI